MCQHVCALQWDRIGLYHSGIAISSSPPRRWADLVGFTAAFANGEVQVLDFFGQCEADVNGELLCDESEFRVFLKGPLTQAWAVVTHLARQAGLQSDL